MTDKQFKKLMKGKSLSTTELENILTYKLLTLIKQDENDKRKTQLKQRKGTKNV